MVSCSYFLLMGMVRQVPCVWGFGGCCIGFGEERLSAWFVVNRGSAVAYANRLVVVQICTSVEDRGCGFLKGIFSLMLPLGLKINNLRFNLLALTLSPPSHWIYSDDPSFVTMGWRSGI